ncbi:MAG TPA: decaprenylphospho-beta-D-erythro-pentofuranosid-2-ulose 2-reductase [Acidimicrobiales bacterium]|nr:decaprenylphospho-beta-D-erythro-pentofuranosid-2-ulose 2-reductase [Acidimicrobiales bacterium]
MKDALGRPQSVLVIGATSDIARSVLSKLAGAVTSRMVLAARDQDRLAQVEADLRQQGVADVRTISFDAIDIASHAGLVADAFSRGDIDVVLVAFGVLGDQLSDERDPVAAASVMQVNATAAVSVGVACAEALAGQGHGTLVALSSVAGERARRSNFIYGASKAGMDAFYQGLAASLADRGVDVVVVRPGFVHTRMTVGLKPPPLSTDADSVAEAVVAAMAGGSATVWVPKPLRLVMAVLRHLPTPVFRRLPL